MNISKIGKLAAAAALLLTIYACGGGGGGGGTTVGGGGTGGSGISFGSVSQFGSIWVNGVRFSTDSVSFTRNGVTSTMDDSQVRAALKLGMVVEVQGTIASSTSGSATTVVVKEAVRGPVETKSGTLGTNATLIVLGQTVRVDDTTLFDSGFSFGTIVRGDLLEVHGQRNNDGTIAATFIERKIPPLVFEVRGPITGHSAATQTFTIGALTVNYAAPAIINNMPAPSGSNWIGLFVEAKGPSTGLNFGCTGVLPVCGTLTATQVEPDGLRLANAAQAEVEGFVTTLVSTSDFKIGPQRVVTTGSTVFLGGLQEEIVLGVKLEVEGGLAGGVLTASKVKFKDSVRIESNAVVSGLNITLDGLPGITVTVNAFTQFKNTAATATNPASLNGRSVRIRGRASSPTTVIATEIEDRGIAGNDISLQDFAKNIIGTSTFTLLGVTVNTSLLSDSPLINSDFGGVDDTQITRAGFFSAISPNGGLVKAKGRLSAVPPPLNENALAGNLIREVELED